MGARHSKRSMDVTTTPKKEGIAEGGEAPAVGDGKLERIEETDAKPTTNGVAHTDAPEDKDNVKEKDLPEKETNKAENETKSTEESPAEATASPAEDEQVTTPTEDTNTSTTTACSPETKETKKKEKSKKKWSFRSISFSKKDKNKPVREDTPKNGDVSKEEPLAEGGEEAENAATSPAEEKSVASLNESAAPENEVKNEEKPATPEVESSPEEKQEAPSSPTAPIPVPVEEKKEEKTENKVEKVEVSPTQAVAAPIEVMSQPQPIITPSIIERKTSEDFPSHFPSSPPPTPINPSPLQQAQQAAANASALAEALKLPAEDQVNACRLDHGNTDHQVENNKTETHETNVEIQSEAIETEQAQSIVEDVSPKDIDIPKEEYSVSDKNDSIKTSPIEVKVAVETIATVQQKTSIESSEQIEGDSKTEENITSEQLNQDNSYKDASIDMAENVTPKTETEDEEIPPPLPASPIPVPKASSQFMNFITSQIEDTPPLESVETTIASEVETQLKSDVEDLSLQSMDNSIPSPLTEAATDTLIDPQMSLSSEDVNDLPPPPPPEEKAFEQVPDLVSSNSQETVEDVLTLPRSPSPIVSPETIESSIKSVESEMNNKNIEAYQNNDELVEELIAPIEGIVLHENGEAESELKNRQSNSFEKITASDDNLLAHHIQKNNQSISETEAPVENSTTESAEETPKSPPVFVQSEITAPVPPAITEDVTSVTKAVEEIDINEKAVAAAVNENIESANKNEIIADMNYQNNLNE